MIGVITFREGDEKVLDVAERACSPAAVDDFSLRRGPSPSNVIFDGELEPLNSAPESQRVDAHSRRSVRLQTDENGAE